MKPDVFSLLLVDCTYIHLKSQFEEILFQLVRTWREKERERERKRKLHCTFVFIFCLRRGVCCHWCTTNSFLFCIEYVFRLFESEMSSPTQSLFSPTSSRIRNNNNNDNLDTSLNSPRSYSSNAPRLTTNNPETSVLSPRSISNRSEMEMSIHSSQSKYPIRHFSLSYKKNLNLRLFFKMNKYAFRKKHLRNGSIFIYHCMNKNIMLKIYLMI